MACLVQSKMDGAGQSTKDKFEKQKGEVLEESKENIKEAESTLQVTVCLIRLLLYHLLLCMQALPSVINVNRRATCT